MAIDSYNPMNIRPLLKQHERKLIEHCFFSLQCSYTSFDAWRQSFIIRTHRITPTMVPLATTSHKVLCAHKGARLLCLFCYYFSQNFMHTQEHAYYVHFATTSHKISCTHRSTPTMAPLATTSQTPSPWARVLELLRNSRSVWQLQHQGIWNPACWCWSIKQGVRVFYNED